MSFRVALAFYLSLFPMECIVINPLELVAPKVTYIKSKKGKRSESF